MAIIAGGVPPNPPAALVKQAGETSSYIFARRSYELPVSQNKGCMVAAHRAIVVEKTTPVYWLFICAPHKWLETGGATFESRYNIQLFHLCWYSSLLCTDGCAWMTALPMFVSTIHQYKTCGFNNNTCIVAFSVYGLRLNCRGIDKYHILEWLQVYNIAIGWKGDHTGRWTKCLVLHCLSLSLHLLQDESFG